MGGICSTDNDVKPQSASAPQPQQQQQQPQQESQPQPQQPQAQSRPVDQPTKTAATTSASSGGGIGPVDTGVDSVKATVTSVVASADATSHTATATATDNARTVMATATATASAEEEAVKGAVTAAVTGVTAHTQSTAPTTEAKVAEAEAVAKAAAAAAMHKAATETHTHNGHTTAAAPATVTADAVPATATATASAARTSVVGTVPADVVRSDANGSGGAVGGTFVPVAILKPDGSTTLVPSASDDVVIVDNTADAVTAKNVVQNTNETAAVSATSSTHLPTTVVGESSDAASVLVVFYSLYGHIYRLAEAVVEGAKEAGVTVALKQVAETLPTDVLEKMHAPPKADVPIVTVADLPQYDAIIVGAGTRFGGMPAQMKAFWDATGQLWQSGALVGKVGGAFTSSATAGGGQETTIAMNLTHFAHHGMLYVPLGYTDATIFSLDEVHGGSPWGAGTFAGPTGERKPSALELGLARSQGRRIAQVANALKKGRRQ